jgi:hypothetical protein
MGMSGRSSLRAITHAPHGTNSNLVCTAGPHHGNSIGLSGRPSSQGAAQAADTTTTMVQFTGSDEEGVGTLFHNRQRSLILQ